MEIRPLGKSGLEVSILGLGTVKLGRNRDVRYPQHFDLPTDDQARALLLQAAAVGINLIDTAPAYGSSEARLGGLLHGQRARWVLATKVGEEHDVASRFDFSPEHVAASVTRSLTRLGTDYLDIVLIHSDGNDLDILDRYGTLQALQDLNRRGVIRAVGISHKTVPGGSRAIELGADVIMATLNAADQSQLGLIAEAGRAGCGVLVKKALASGHADAAYLATAAAAPGVSSIVVGTLNPAHLAANARLVSAPGRARE